MGYFSHELIQSQNQTTAFAVHWFTVGLVPVQHVARGRQEQTRYLCCHCGMELCDDKSLLGSQHGRIMEKV